MPNIQAFRGIRYDLGRVGTLADVTAPPYDVISPEFQQALYDRHPNNCVRLILNKILPGDDDEKNNRYTRASKYLKKWQEEGILFTETQPCIYVYHQVFTYAGKTYTRRGFMAGLEVQRFGEGCVFPHEQTHASAKMDRLMLTTVTRTNLSQIFGLYPDKENEVQGLLESAIVGKTPLEVEDHLGVTHRLWPMSDPDVIASVQVKLGPKPLFIADGHHRYETACNYLDQLKDTGISSDHPAHYVLSMFIAMEDPGLAVLPTHRLFPGVSELTAEELRSKLGECFSCEDAGVGADAAENIWEDVETRGNQGVLALFTARDQRWTVATLTEAGKRRMAQDDVAGEHSEEWRDLGVSILHKLVMDTLLGEKDAPKPVYVHLVSEVVAGLKEGGFPLAALVMPATVRDIRTLSMQGERMPQKSTYFYPKLLSGLVFRSLE